MENEKNKEKRVYIKLAELYIKLKITERQLKKEKERYIKINRKYRKLYDKIRGCNLDEIDMKTKEALTR